MSPAYSLPFKLNPYNGQEPNLNNSPLWDSGLYIATFSSAAFENGTLQLNFNNPSPSDMQYRKIEAGVPYIIKWDTNNDPLTAPLFKDVTIDATMNDEECPFTGGSITFRGTYSTEPIYTTDHTNLFLGDANTLYYPADEDVMVKAGRAYFQLNGIRAGDPASAGVHAFVVNFGEGEETAIKSIDDLTISDLTLESDTWYTLDGQKLNSKPTARGIYIHSTPGHLKGKNNVRKVVVE